MSSGGSAAGAAPEVGRLPRRGRFEAQPCPWCEPKRRAGSGATRVLVRTPPKPSPGGTSPRHTKKTDTGPKKGGKGGEGGKSRGPRHHLLRLWLALTAFFWSGGDGFVGHDFENFRLAAKRW